MDERDELLENIEREAEFEHGDQDGEESAASSIAEIRRLLRVARDRGVVRYPRP